MLDGSGSPQKLPQLFNNKDICLESQNQHRIQVVWRFLMDQGVVSSKNDLF